MAHRIEVSSKIDDMRAESIRRKIRPVFPNIKHVELVEVYTTEDSLKPEQLKKVSSMLSNPVWQEAGVDSPKIPQDFDFAVEIGFLPGVKNNVGDTAREGIEDAFKTKIEGQAVYTSQVMFLSGLKKEEAEKVGEMFSNPVIQRVHMKSRVEFLRDKGMDLIIPRVKLKEHPKADLVDILNMDDEQLTIVGKQGILNSDGTRRGPLALDLNYMRTIKDYFAKKRRNPFDVELESIAQTWSEHCKHTIMADPIDDIKEGLFKRFIKGATEEVRRRKGLSKDICVSVFKDNSGAIVFDNNFLITHKVETHNSPSALDPFGGAITGIVGVYRDAIGFGLGAKPIISVYGFCFGNPYDERALYKGKNFTQKMLPPRRIGAGVIEGVQVGANCSGNPAPQGFAYYDDRFKGKPVVYVGIVGLIPRTSLGRDTCEKKAENGDYIVMTGGRVGKDGIHGATFSSEAIDSGSPATAVQIGDPITQKKLSDATIKEARDLGLYNSITDNGAGGLSCSVAEMARESGGCKVYLDKVPLKYPGLAPWEIWISESQERMTLSVPKGKWARFKDLMERRGVEANIIGEFTDSGKCEVDYHGDRVMDIDMDFLHDGLPPRPMTTTFTRIKQEEPEIQKLGDLTSSLHDMLKRQNIASFEFISQQYDHEVQGGSVIKPLQGAGRVNGNSTVSRPRLDSNKGVVLSQALFPSYSDIDTYNMAACSIDTAIRNAVATGASLEKIALLDNFCWCSSNDKERLGQLKRAVQACYDYSVAFETPFISGKDSMFNDFKGFDDKGNPIQISIPPTLLISSIGVVDDVRKTISIDAKVCGDLVYVLGETKEELGGSEFFAMKGEQQNGKTYIGNNVPSVDAERNIKVYRALEKAIAEELVSSSISVERGGLGVALAKTAMAGNLGMSIFSEKIQGDWEREDFALYSESQGRVVVTINPKYKEKFEEIMKDVSYSEIGFVTEDRRFVVRSGIKKIIDTEVQELADSYKSTFKEF